VVISSIPLAQQHLNDGHTWTSIISISMAGLTLLKLSWKSSDMKQFVPILFMAILSACGAQNSASIQDACIDEGGDAASCKCMTENVKAVVSQETFSSLAIGAREDKADGLAKALMSLDGDQRLKAGLAMSKACNGEDMIFTKSVLDKPPSNTGKGTVDDMIAVCEARGHSNSVCECWGHKLKADLSPGIFQLIADGSLDGDQGYALAVNSLPEEERLSVGIVLLETNEVCAPSSRDESSDENP
jgi:hypothetical protein